MKIFKRSNRYSFYAAILICLSIIVGNRPYFNDFINETQLSVISWDVYGYYLYLPAAFIYDDIGLQKESWLEEINKKYKPSASFYQVVDGKDNKKVIIYQMGLSIIYAPAFLITHFITQYTNYPADGFSNPYHLAIIITSLLFSFFGVLMLGQILLHFFTDKLSASIMIIIFLGTNYFLTAGVFGSMPHNFMFALNCLILWLTIKWHQSNNIKYAAAMGFILGLATISRPTELIYILIPVLWGVKNRETFFQKIRMLVEFKSHVLAFAISFTVLCLPQMIYYKFTSGSYFALNLHSETLSLLSPYILEFLFSYKKGWFVYTPIMLFLIIGFFSLYRYNRKIFIAIFSLFIVNVYVLSSWECWWYGDSFGQRAMVESYAILALPLGYFIKLIGKSTLLYRVSCIVVISLFFILNAFQSWQYLNGIIDQSRMTGRYYWRVFGKTTVTDKDRNLLEVERSRVIEEYFNDDESKYYKKQIINLDFEKDITGLNQKAIIDTFGCESKRCFRMDSNVIYSPGVNEKYYEITNKYYMWVRASIDVYPTTSHDNGSSCLVIAIDSKKRNIKYRSECTGNLKLKPHQWNKITIDYMTPVIRHYDDRLKVYYWNMDKKMVYIDNLRVEVLEPRRVNR